MVYILYYIHINIKMFLYLYFPPPRGLKKNEDNFSVLDSEHLLLLSTIVRYTIICISILLLYIYDIIVLYDN